MRGVPYVCRRVGYGAQGAHGKKDRSRSERRQDESSRRTFLVFERFPRHTNYTYVLGLCVGRDKGEFVIDSGFSRGSDDGDETTMFARSLPSSKSLPPL